MNKLSRTKYTLLGMLTIRPMSGYEIKETIRTSTSFFWSESEGQIYPALAECVKLGFATFHEENAENTKRNKKIYQITEKGRGELVSWLKQEAKDETVRNELLLKLFFGLNNDPKDNIHHVRSHQKKLIQILKTFENIYESLMKEQGSPHLPYWLITLNCGIKHSQAELGWCEETLELLETSQEK